MSAQKGRGKNHPGFVRIGIVGAGNMGGWHAQSIVEGRAGRCRLSAVCDLRPEIAGKWPGIPGFTDSRKLLRSGLVDAVVIATPHFDHTTVAIDALNAGLHVMTEKPLAVHKADALRMAKAHGRHRKLVFAAMYQMRTYGMFRKLREILSVGMLGRIDRIMWVATDWFRSEAYYSSGGWRATWKGEGGGLLTNQCVHNLDMWQWLFGMPEVVTGFCGFGRFHDIEVEDEVTAHFRYRDGKTGVFVASTGEIPGINRLEIWGDRGRITAEGGRISFARTEVPTREFSRTSKMEYSTPDHWLADVPVGEAGGDHAKVLANFADAIIDGAPLIAPAMEGIRQVELSNAIVYSAIEGKPVRLPMPAGEFARRLARLQARSRRKYAVKTAGGIREVPRYIVR